MPSWIVLLIEKYWYSKLCVAVRCIDAIPASGFVNVVSILSPRTRLFTWLINIRIVIFKLDQRQWFWLLYKQYIY